MATNLVGDLGKTIAGSISQSLSGFGAGLKGAAMAGNPAVFGPALASLTKMMKADQTQRQRDKAFEEEKSLEQKKLFTDILGEQKKTNQTLSDILKALLGFGKSDENSFLNFLKNLGLAIAGAFVKGFDKLLKLFRGFLDLFKTKFDDILARFRSILRFLEDGLARLGKIVNFIGDVLRGLGNGLLRFLDFLKNLRVKFPSLDNLFKFFEDLPRRFGDFFKNIFDRFKKLPFIDDLIKFFSDLPRRFGDFFTNLFDRFKKLPFIDDLVKFFSDLPNRFMGVFTGLLDTFKNAFDNFKSRFRIPNFDDIIKAFDDFKSRIRLPNFDDVVRAIEGIFSALPASFGRLKNATLINVAILADLLDEVKANIGAKFDTFKATFTDAFGKVGSYFDDLAIKFDSLRTSALESFKRVTAAFSDGRLALSLDDLSKIMPEILGGTGGFLESISAKLGYFYQTYVVETVQKGLKAMGNAIEAIKNSEVVKILGDIGKKLLKFLIPLDIILSVFDGLLVAFDEDKIGSIIDKNAIEVTFMDRVAAFLGGGLSSFFLGFIDIASQVLNYAISNIFGEGATWAESYNTGLQEVGTFYVTRLFENIFGFVKETARLIGALFTFDGEGIKNAFNELYLIFDDFVVNIANFGMEILDRIGIRKLFIRMGNVIGSWWNDLSNSIGEGWFNAKKYIFGIVGKSVDASVNFIGPAIVGMFNAISKGVNAVTSWVVDKIATLIGYVPGLGEVAKKVAEFGKNIQIQETKFEPYQSGMTKEADKMAKEGFKKTTFTATDENYVRDRDAVVSDKQRRDRDSANERKRETRGVTTPAPVPVAPAAAAPASLPGQSPVYTPTNVSNNAPVSVRNNNPGNLRYYSRYAGPGGVLEGAIPGPDGSFAQFPSPEMGMAAMQRQLQLDTQSRGMTLTQFISKYAPPGDNNDTGAYVANMSRSLGIGPNDRIPSHLIPQLQSAMIRQEGGPAASNYYSGVQPGSGGSSFAFRPPSLMTVGMPGQYGGGGGSGGGAYDTGRMMQAATGTFGQGDFEGSFNGTLTGPEQTYVRNVTTLQQGIIDGIESRRPSTTAYTGQDADSRLISLNSTSNEMESQNLVYQRQIATGIQNLNNQYGNQRKSLEMQFLGQIQGDVSRSIYKAIGGSQGFGVMGQQNSAFGSINQLYQSSFQNFATKILGKDMGPIYGNIFSQLAASYTDQFVNTVLGPMFGPNAAQGFNRAINNYAQGASIRKQYDVLKADYDQTKVEFDTLSSQVTLVDRLNAMNPITGKIGADKLQTIQKVDALEQLLGQKGQQVSQAKAAKDQNKKMVTEDLIFAMTGIPTGMRSLFGYEEGIQNFSQQMALMIGQPFSPLFGGAGGYEEYQRNVERQMKLGVDSQGRYMEQGALQMRDGMVYAGDYHNQGMSQVLGNHLQGMSNITQYSLQSQAQIAQMQQRSAQMQMIGGMAGGGGGGFFSSMGSIWEGVKSIGSAVSDVFSGTKSIGDAVKGIFSPTSASGATGAGGTIPGQTGPGTPVGGGFSMGNALVDFGTMYAAQKLGLGFGPATFAMNALGKNFVAGKGFEGAGDILKGGAGGIGIGGTLFNLWALKNADVRSPGGLINTALAGYQIYNALATGSLLASGAGLAASAGMGLVNMGATGMGTTLLNFSGGMQAANAGMNATQLAAAYGEAGMAVPTGMTSGVYAGTALQGLAGGMAGSFIGSAIAGDKQIISGVSTSTIGSMIGNFIMPGIGGLVGGILGGIADSFFGSGPKRTDSAGITGTLAEGSGTSIRQYENWSRSGGKFSGGSSGRNYSEADPELVKYMQGAVNNVFTGVREGANILGIDPNAITGFTKAIEINLMGLSQADQAKRLQESILGFSDDMIKTAYADIVKYQIKVGDALESITTTFSRLIESTLFMNNAFEMLKYTSDDLAKTIGGTTGLALADLKYDIMTMFGGKDLREQQDNFNKFVGDYYKTFYTQEEQLTFSLNQKKKEFEAIETEIKTKINIPGLEGFDIPEFKGTVEESRIAYREFVDNFVKSTGLATDESRAIYAKLIQSGPLFYEGAQQFVQLNQVQKKKKSREELIAEGTALTGTFMEAAGSIGAGVFGGEFANTVTGVSSSLDYISSTLSNVPSGGIIPTETLGTGSQQFLREQGNALIKSFEAGTNVNTVVDNSVRQVSSPITTFVMKDDKVRDFHPILRNTERSSLRAYTLAMR